MVKKVSKAKNITSAKKISSVNSDKILADALFPLGNEEDDHFSESVLNLPPEKRKLITESNDFSVSTLIEKLTKKLIVIPEFQRGYVWQQTTASRLIESLIIQCPIPVIYLSQNRDETLSVVDGNQRLNSIKNFMEGKFTLKGLTAYPELTGHTFQSLDTRFQRHIENRTLRCITVLKETHPQVKFDVFERLNSGSVKLSAQELRHGIYHSELMKMLKSANSNPQWKQVGGKGIALRMKGEELILRFVALSSDFKSYKKPLTSFLNDFSEKNRRITTKQASVFERRFLDTLETTIRLFGDDLFRLESGGQFNSAVFDAQMVGVFLALADKKSKSLKKSDLSKEFRKLCSNQDFFNSISRSTSDEGAVEFRINSIKKLVEKVV